MDPIARLALPRAAMAWKTALDSRLNWSACGTQPLPGDMISSGPAIRKRKKSNALRSRSLMQNFAMDNGAVGVGLRDDAGNSLVICSGELPEEEASSPPADGLLEAGRRGRAVIVRLDGSEYPPQVRPAAVHFAHTGRVSSHLTRLVLYLH